MKNVVNNIYYLSTVILTKHQKNVIGSRHGTQQRRNKKILELLEEIRTVSNILSVGNEKQMITRRQSSNQQIRKQNPSPFPKKSGKKKSLTSNVLHRIRC